MRSLLVAATVGPPSANAVTRLRNLGLTPVLLTRERGFRPVGRPEVLSTDEVDVVKQFQADGKVVVVFGDCFNDAAALAQADLASRRAAAPTSPLRPAT